MLHLKLIFLVILLSGISLEALACTSPNGMEGQIYYNSTAKKLYFCDGTSWQDLARQQSAAAEPACGAATEANTYYNTTSKKMFVCNGTAWVELITGSATPTLTDVTGAWGCANAWAWNTSTATCAVGKSLVHGWCETTGLVTVTSGDGFSINSIPYRSGEGITCSGTNYNNVGNYCIRAIARCM